jgi:hypothetical protein
LAPEENPATLVPQEGQKLTPIPSGLPQFVQNAIPMFISLFQLWANHNVFFFISATDNHNSGTPLPLSHGGIRRHYRK